MWEKPEVDLLLKVYLFNITNKDAFLKGTEKLKVQEVGPYVYKLVLHSFKRILYGISQSSPRNCGYSSLTSCLLVIAD